MPRPNSSETRFCRTSYLAGLGIALLTLLGLESQSDASPWDQFEIFGTLSLESRLFRDDGLYVGQNSHASGFSAEATAYIEDQSGRSFTVTPFLRYDSGDSDRTRVDIREAYLLLYGSIGNDEWELRLGLDKVYWGVVESRSLVDIVNQIDFIEHPNEKTRLGQLMAHFTWAGDWGSLELFGMTWHRPRTLPGRGGRFRSSLVANQDLVEYESSSEEWNIDLAGRYTTSIGPLDIGLSLFDGTSRDPTLQPTISASGLVLVPFYELIRQVGIDAQLIAGSLLLKLEAIHRSGSQNRRLDQFLRYEEEDYEAFIAGGEYSFNGVWESNVDLTVIGEWSRDGRGEWATNAFENDVLTAIRVGLNDEQSTEFFLSVVNSLETSARIFNSELTRRISDYWSFSVEAFVYSDVEPDDLLYEVRRDSFLALKLDCNF